MGRWIPSRRRGLSRTPATRQRFAKLGLLPTGSYRFSYDMITCLVLVLGTLGSTSCYRLACCSALGSPSSTICRAVYFVCVRNWETKIRHRSFVFWTTRRPARSTRLTRPPARPVLRCVRPSFRPTRPLTRQFRALDPPRPTTQYKTICDTIHYILLYHARAKPYFVLYIKQVKWRPQVWPCVNTLQLRNCQTHWAPFGFCYTSLFHKRIKKVLKHICLIFCIGINVSIDTFSKRP